MALSEAKLAANRRNALRSTGPRTAAGKARARLNALKHGILASEAIIRAGEGAEEAEAFDRLLAELRADLAPVGALEELLLEKLAVIVWRWRRVLRYELGAIRERADEAVAEWTRRQREAAEERRLLAAQYGGAAKPWEPTPDLEGRLEEAEERLEALKRPDPLVNQPEALVWFLAEQVEKRGHNVNRVLGLRGPGEWWERPDEWPPDAAARLFEAYRGDQEPAEAWQWLRVSAELERDKARAALERRRLAEERVRLLAVLPDDAKLERVMRYEAHLSREFARTLAQLEQARALAGAGGQAKAPAVG